MTRILSSEWPLFISRAGLAFSVAARNLTNTRVGSAVKDYRLRIKGNTPDMGLPGIVFLGCTKDEYRDHALKFLDRLENSECRLNIHIHLHDPSQDILDHIDNIRRSFRSVALSFTWEDGEYKKLKCDQSVYLSGIRFVVLHHMLLACRSPILCIGVGDNIDWPFVDLLKKIQEADVTLQFRPGKQPLSRKIATGAVGVIYTKEALGFCEKLAACMWAALQRAHHDTVDQPILSYLYAVRRRIKRRVRWQSMPLELGPQGDDSIVGAGRGTD